VTGIVNVRPAQPAGASTDIEAASVSTTDSVACAAIAVESAAWFVNVTLSAPGHATWSSDVITPSPVTEVSVIGKSFGFSTLS
jgi:hypothetical protein